jgi:adenylate cyclase
MTFKSLRFINPITLSISAIIVVLVLFLTGTTFLDLIELKTYDLRFLSRAHQKPTPAVVLAMIDEKSLDVEGRWPWPRSKIAALVDILSADGAKVIGFDIGFLEPDENTELGFIHQLDQQISALNIKESALIDFISQRRKAADNDLALALAIDKSSATVVLGYFFHMDEASLQYRIEPAEFDKRLSRITASKYPLVLFQDPQMRVKPFIDAYAPETNLEIFSEVADGAGYFSVAGDQDGVVRWMPLTIKCGDNIFPPLSLMCVWHFLDKPQLMVKVSRYGVDGIQLGQYFMPTEANGEVLVNYLGPSRTFPHISVTDILRGKIAKGRFKDTIVLVGATAMGTHDLRSTPMGPVYPGAEIHATVMDNMLTQNFITRPNWSKIYDLVAIILLGAITGLALPRVSAIKGLGLATGLFVLHIVIARVLFVSANVWINIVYPLLVLMVTYTAITVYQYITEERQKKEIKSAFSHYAAKRVIDQMLANPDQLKLGGEEKIITVLFCDLEGFTAHSETHTPGAMISILSEYFSQMTEQVFAYDGLLKEYVGDEIMAIFGAPMEQPDHAHRACRAALAMQERLSIMRMEWEHMDRPILRARVGINTGPMLVGNIGSKYRFSYGALGDEVNLGSRLEGLNKQYGTEILMGENTADVVKDAFRLREIDFVRVKGKQKPVRVYELLGLTGARFSESREKCYQLYKEGLEAYRAREWKKAMERFAAGLEVQPHNKAFDTMSIRCRLCQQTPPPDKWDGAFIERRK